MLKALYFLCYKISVPVWLMLLLAVPTATYIGYLKYSSVVDNNTILSLQNEIKTLKYQNNEYEASINRLNANLDVKNIQIHDTNFRLSQCFNSLTKLQTGYNEIEAIMDSDGCVCDGQSQDTKNDENTHATNTHATNTQATNTEKQQKVKTISTTVNKNGILFLNKQLGEILK